jgi:tetratricopeptide (TPR) repeat protein
MTLEEFQLQVSAAHASYRAHQFGATFAILEHLLTVSPFSVELLLLRGRTLQLMSDEDAQQFPQATLEEAHRNLKDAVALSPKNQEALLELAHFEYAVLDRSEEALELFSRAEQFALQWLGDAILGEAKCAADLGDELALKSASERLKQLELEHHLLDIAHA